jgi:hypothetical protein
VAYILTKRLSISEHNDSYCFLNFHLDNSKHTIFLDFELIKSLFFISFINFISIFLKNINCLELFLFEIKHMIFDFLWIYCRLLSHNLLVQGFLHFFKFIIFNFWQSSLLIRDSLRNSFTRLWWIWLQSYVLFSFGFLNSFLDWKNFLKFIFDARYQVLAVNLLTFKVFLEFNEFFLHFFPI